MVKKLTTVLTASLLLAGLAGCATRAQSGVGIGSLVGGAAGAIIGHQSGHAGAGALIGTGIGAAGGYMTGNEFDKRDMRHEIRQVRDEANSEIVNVRNSNGSISPVTVRRSGNGWIGPRGEIYAARPSEEQLRSVYGF